MNNHAAPTDVQRWHSLPAMFFARAVAGGNKPFLWAKQESGRWRRTFEPLSWHDVAAQVRAFSRGIRALGVEAGDRVLLCAENRPEWAIADLAIMAAQAVTVPTDAGAPPLALRQTLADCGARLAVCSNALIAARILQAAEKDTALEFVIAIEPPISGESTPLTLIRWRDAISLGETQPDDVGEVVAAINGGDLACIIYTAGTSGAPKGVMLSHRAILGNCTAAMGVLEEFPVGGDVFLSYLPLHHAYEHTLGLMFPIVLGAQIYYAGRADRVTVDMVKARPTIMTSVPRLYQLLYHRIRAQMHRQGPWKTYLFKKTLEYGERRYHKGGRLGGFSALADLILDRLVRNRVRALFGGRLKALVSGGAPLPFDVGLFFTALGVKILQGYGQAEAGPLISCNGRHVKLDTVGPPVNGVELKIADDGEILVRGDMVMLGYWNRVEQTAETLRDGWLHTGDVGELDQDGYLRITDRKKDVIITTGGGVVAPQYVQGLLTLRPEIDQVLVFGDRESHLAAIIVPTERIRRIYGRGEDDGSNMAMLAEDPAVRQALATAVDKANEDLGPAEQVRRFVVAAERFTVENGLLTSTLKLRRDAILERYREAIMDARWNRLTTRHE